MTCASEESILTAAEERRIAAALIPRSRQPGSALAVRPAPLDVDGAGPTDNGLLTASAVDGTDPLRDDHPLKGVRFANLTAPGPTGTRAEHARECLGIKQRPIANRLARAMLRVQTAARNGPPHDEL